MHLITIRSESIEEYFRTFDFHFFNAAKSGFAFRILRFNDDIQDFCAVFMLYHIHEIGAVSATRDCWYGDAVTGNFPIDNNFVNIRE